MGNRAIISVGADPAAPSIYLHWNGGPESIIGFLIAAKALGVRSPADDDSYFLARLAQIIANFFGGTTSIGIGKASEMDDGDNGRYYVGGDFVITRRQVSGAKDYSQLSPEEQTTCDAIAAKCIEINQPFFNQ